MQDTGGVCVFLEPTIIYLYIFCVLNTEQWLALFLKSTMTIRNRIIHLHEITNNSL